MGGSRWTRAVGDSSQGMLYVEYRKYDDCALCAYCCCCERFDGYDDLHGCENAWDHGCRSHGFVDFCSCIDFQSQDFAVDSNLEAS